MLPRLPFHLIPFLLVSAGCDRPALLGEPSEGWATPDRPALHVTITDTSGQPLEGAWAVLTPTGRDKQSDGGGLASFHALDPGQYTVEGAARGHSLERVRIEVGEADVSLTMTLPPRDGGHSTRGASR